MESGVVLSRTRGGEQPPDAAAEEPDGALAFLRRLPPEAQRAAAALAASSDERGERVLRRITRLLLAADLDTAMDALAQQIDFGVRAEALTEAEIEEAAVRLTATRA